MALLNSNKLNIVLEGDDLKTPLKPIANEAAFHDFQNVLDKLSKKNFFKNVPWSDIKKNYKKKTGRVLNAEELNAMVGTSGLSRNDIIRTKLSCLLKFADEKNQVMTIVKSGLTPSKKPWHPSGEQASENEENMRSRSTSVSSNFSSTCPNTSDDSRCASPDLEQEDDKENTTFDATFTKSDVDDAKEHKSFSMTSFNQTFNTTMTTEVTHGSIHETPATLKDISKILTTDYLTPNMPTYYNYYHESELELEASITDISYTKITSSSLEESSTSASFFECQESSSPSSDGDLCESFDRLGIYSPETGAPPSMVSRFSIASSQEVYETAPTSPERLDNASNSTFSAYQSAVEDFDSEVEVETEEDMTPPASPLGQTLIEPDEEEEEDPIPRPISPVAVILSNSRDDSKLNEPNYDDASMYVHYDESNNLKNLSQVGHLPDLQENLENTAPFASDTLLDHDYLETKTCLEVESILDQKVSDISAKELVEIDLHDLEEALKSADVILGEKEDPLVDAETQTCLEIELDHEEEIEMTNFEASEVDDHLKTCLEIEPQDVKQAVESQKKTRAMEGNLGTPEKCTPEAEDGLKTCLEIDSLEEGHDNPTFVPDTPLRELKKTPELDKDPSTPPPVLSSVMDFNRTMDTNNSRLPVLYAEEPDNFTRPTISRPDAEEEDDFEPIIMGESNVQAPKSAIKAIRRGTKCCTII